MFQRIKRESGVRAFSAHLMRHTWATNFMRAPGASVLELQRQGGWRRFDQVARRDCDLHRSRQLALFPAGVIQTSGTGPDGTPRADDPFRPGGWRRCGPSEEIALAKQDAERDERRQLGPGPVMESTEMLTKTGATVKQAREQVVAQTLYQLYESALELTIPRVSPRSAGRAPLVRRSRARPAASPDAP